MISDYERDQLARISHRGLRGLKGSSISPAAKMTNQNLQTLKTKAQDENQLGVQYRRFIDRLRACVSTTFSGLFSGDSTVKHKQCQLYGHTLPRNGWEGATPKCQDCGADIESSDQVRGATLLQDRGGKSPNDSQTISGQNRKFVK